MGVNSYSMGRVKYEFELVAKDCIIFVKSGEYNKHSGEFYQTPLHTVCLRICLWMHPRYGEKNMTEQNVTRLFEPVVGYLSLLSELNILKRKAARFGIPLDKETKPKPEEETKQEQQTEQEDNRWDILGARKHFKKAIKAGLMEQTEDEHYRWKRSKKNPKAALGYFLQKVYNPDGCQQIPYKSLEKLFGEKRLDSTIGSLIYSEYSEKQQPWKKPIDNLFDD